MNVEFLPSKAFSNFENDKVQESDIWKLKIHALWSKLEFRLCDTKSLKVK